MGVNLSKASGKSAGGMVVSLDALGTLYRFREPFPVQYRKMARECGLKAEVDVDKLEKSFKSALNFYSTTFPNYGKGTLNDPEAWWTKLVNRAFSEVVDGEKIPAELGPRLYEHFSSGAAYELYPDAHEFLELMRKFKIQYSAADGPMFLTGIITNSDPRVRRVLQSLNLRVGPSTQPHFSASDQWETAMREGFQLRTTGSVHMRTQWHEYYNAANDFDFLATSYETGFEKPDPGIYQAAVRLAAPMPMSRAEQQMEEVKGQVTGVFKLASTTLVHATQLAEMQWIHVGDDYIKDYRGAEGAGLEALHLVREGEGEAKPGAKTVSSLEEVAAIVNVIAEESFAKA